MWLRDLYEFGTLGQVVMGVLLMPAHGHLSIEGPHEFECRGCVGFPAFESLLTRG
jgi:hypothetical protein